MVRLIKRRGHVNGMWRMTAVAVVAVMVSACSVVQAGTPGTPQGPRREGGGKQVAKVDDSATRLYDRPWAIVVRTAGEETASSPPFLKAPSNSYIVSKMRIKYMLCHKEGIFAMFQECDYFFYCTPNIEGGEQKFNQILGVCENGYAFDDDKKDCIQRPCHTGSQNDPYPSPPGHQGDSILPPASAAPQVPSWFSEEPVWFSRQPAFFKTPPVWYHTPPAWYNAPPTSHDTGEQKAQTEAEIKRMRQDIIKNVK